MLARKIEIRWSIRIRCILSGVASPKFWEEPNIMTAGNSMWFVTLTPPLEAQNHKIC